MAKLRDDYVRGLFFVVFAMFFVSNGADFEVPILKVPLSKVPALHALLGFAASILMLMYSMAAISTGTYAGLIRQFHNFIARQSKIDADILSASKSPFWFVLKIFQPDFNNYLYGSHIKPVGFTIFANFIARGVVWLFFLSTTIGVYVYIGHFILIDIPSGWFNFGVKIVSSIALIGAALLGLFADTPMKYEEATSPSSTPLEDQSSQK